MTTFNVLAVDCPWQPKDKLPGPGRGAAKKYKTLSMDQLAKMPFERVTSFRFPKVADDAIMFFWRLSSMQEEALHICQEWGFTVKSEVVWAKYYRCVDCKGEGSGTDGLGGKYRAGGGRWPHKWKCELCDCTGCGEPWFGMGRYTRASHETCLIATRGKMASKIQAHNIRSVFHAPVPYGADGKVIHSAKPERFYRDVVEKLAKGPYVEMFGRRRRPGWTVLGNQVAGQRRV